jgi:hypothetical protein
VSIVFVVLIIAAYVLDASTAPDLVQLLLLVSIRASGLLSWFRCY